MSQVQMVLSEVKQIAILLVPGIPTIFVAVVVASTTIRGRATSIFGIRLPLLVTMRYVNYFFGGDVDLIYIQIVLQ